MAEEPKPLVLVTGGSGFLGAHCIIACLSAGYRVRTTIRTPNREASVRTMVTAGEATNLSNLTFAIADLTKDAGWVAAVAECTYVLHVASPFPPGAPKHEDDLIIPAREGTLRVLRSARDSGSVKRVVVTSSFAAIGYGHDDASTDKTAMSETTWTNLSGPNVNPYAKSKTLAERAAWDFIKAEGGSLELSVVNPVGIFGPVLGPDFATSIQIVQRLLNGSLPGCPNLSFGIVDVRDVASLHLLAMTSPSAAGERFLAIAPPNLSIQGISLALREKMGAQAKRSPTRLLPNWVLRAVAWFDPAVALIIPELGKSQDVGNEKARRVLGWAPRSNVEAVVAAGESLVRFGLVKG